MNQSLQPAPPAAKAPQASRTAGAGYDSYDARDTRLRGRRLLAARILLFAIIAVTLGLYLLALPGLMSRFATPCADALTQCLITPAQVAPLVRLGITPASLAVMTIVSSYATILLVVAVAALLILDLVSYLLPPDTKLAVSVRFFNVLDRLRYSSVGITLPKQV